GSMCTMHADSTRSVFPKLAAYVSMASTGLPVDTVNLIIASAVHLVIYVENSSGSHRIRSIREVVDTDGLQIISNEVFSSIDDEPCRRAYPLRDKTAALLEAHGYSTSIARVPPRWGGQ
ncbi:MAG: hypothetical protein RL352_332, partial [Actinomycetota bacterium]